jgi:nucleotide-binding universal stress UspA family protein
MDWRRSSHRHLLIALDTSRQTLEALSPLADYLVACEASAHVLNVQRPVASSDDVSQRIVHHVRRAAGERIVAEAVRMLGDREVYATGEMAVGNVAETICATAEARGCTGIVLASGGSASGKPLGRESSVAGVLRRASVPVTIIPAKGRAASVCDRAASREARRAKTSPVAARQMEHGGGTAIRQLEPRRANRVWGRAARPLLECRDAQEGEKGRRVRRRRDHG